MHPEFSATIETYPNNFSFTIASNLFRVFLCSPILYDARVVNDNGNRNYNNVNKRNGGARPDSLLINPIKVDFK